MCEYGDPHGTLTVALVGDSHATNWFPAFERLARHRGWRLIPLTKFSCVFVDMPIWSPNLGREYTECEAWREEVVAQLARIKPGSHRDRLNQWLPVVVDHDNEPERQGKAMARLIKRIPGTVAIMVDTPRSDVDVPACLAKYRKAIEHCTTSRAAAFGWRHLRRETEAARITGATIVDLSDAICPSDPCGPIIGTTLIYRDHHHLTATFAASLARELEAALPPIGPRGGLVRARTEAMASGGLVAAVLLALLVGCTPTPTPSPAETPGPTSATLPTTSGRHRHRSRRPHRSRRHRRRLRRPPHRPRPQSRSMVSAPPRIRGFDPARDRGQRRADLRG